jgi:excisionase family DNA binding protein
MSQSNSNTRWLTVEEVACHVSSLTVHRAARSGKLKASKIGNRLLFSPDSVAIYLEGSANVKTDKEAAAQR